MKSMKSKISYIWLILFSVLVALPTVALHANDDDDDDDDRSGELLSLDDAIARLQQGWDEA